MSTLLFWTDSKVVLGYIANESRRFHVFVANRVQRIRDSTTPEQWLYVKTDDNPADDASRGITAHKLSQLEGELGQISCGERTFVNMLKTSRNM